MIVTPHSDATGEAGAAAPESQSLLGSLKGLLGELPGLVSDRVQLFSLELRRAGQALAMMVAMVAIAAMLLCTAWIAIWIGLAAALIQAGIPWGWVLLAVLALNIGAAAYALMRAKSLSHLLTLPATVRRLTVTPAESTRAGMGDPTALSDDGMARSAAPWNGSTPVPRDGQPVGVVH